MNRSPINSLKPIRLGPAAFLKHYQVRICCRRFSDRVRWDVVILGADALKQNWSDAIKAHTRNGLPRAVVLKVPHHGAANALELKKGSKNYLDLCTKHGALSVLFAGDSKHPHPRVFQELRKNTKLLCLSNGLKGAHGTANPLQLHIPGARAVQASYTCQPQITVEVSASGTMGVPRGASCSVCS